MQTSVYVNSSYKPFISNMGKVHKAIEVKQLFCAEGFYWRDDEFFFSFVQTFVWPNIVFLVASYGQAFSLSNWFILRVLV